MGTCAEQKNICESSAGWSGSDCRVMWPSVTMVRIAAMTVSLWVNVSAVRALMAAAAKLESLTVWLASFSAVVLLLLPPRFTWLWMRHRRHR